MTDLAPTDLLARSVKREDFDETGRAIWVFRADYQPAIAPYDLPVDVMLRDDWLRASVKLESMWASAVAIAGTKFAALSHEIKSGVPLRASRAQDILENADVNGWVPYCAKGVRDYSTTNNGWVSEVVRSTGALGARIIGLNHLDSRRCRRTGDLEIPFVYTDLKGREHELRWYEVIDFVDQPDPAADKLGMGMCAAHRAWKKICYMAAMERYVWEKTTGTGATSIDFVQGVLNNTVKDAIAVAKEEKRQEGFVMYMGRIIAPVTGDQGITLVSIPLKDLPDGFDPEKERQEATIIYANALGLDTQDLRPLTGQALGTSAQSQVLDQKAEGRGLAALRKQIVHKFNQMLLDDKTTFAFTERDWRDKKIEGEVKNSQADFTGKLIQQGVIVPEQGLQLLADEGFVPQEFLAQDATSSVALDDEEKPLTEGERQQAQQVAQGQPEPEVQAPQQQEAQKERERMGRGDLLAMMDDEAVVKAALGLVEEATR